MSRQEYLKLHSWIRRELGKASYCSNDKSHKAKMYDWANISGKYKKELTDYKSLCRSCHVKMDLTEEIRKKYIGNTNHAKKIKQYDIEGNFIKEWDMTKDASLKLNISQSSISNCLKGRTKTAGKYLWRLASASF